MTNTADPNKFLYFSKFDWPRIINPKITFPLNENLESIKETEALSIKQIKNAIAKDPHGHCAIIIETIQGEGGDNHFRTEFFKELRQICDESELLLIYDEVQCGMGITGKMWAWENHGVAPDIFVFGKKSQICGIAASSRIDEVAQNTWVVTSRNNSTWGGNLVDMVRSTRYMEIFRDDNILDYVSNTAGPALIRGLMNIQSEFSDFVSNTRGQGLMCAFDLQNKEMRDKVLKKCWEKYMLVIPCGTKTIRFRPALNVPLSDIEEGLDITRWAVKQVCSGS
jgi:L-lysine 6-transaminase